ncbi:MAG: NosD domain-containing protein [Halobacteriales archaeon]
MARIGAAHALVALCVLGVVVAVGVFAVDPGAADPGPVDFEDTVRVGPLEAAVLDVGPDAAVPRAQVFYGGYRYVVGYEGIDRAVSHLEDEAARLQFGEALAVYATDFAGAAPDVDDEGYLVADGEPVWRPAEDLAYVVDGDVRVPGGGSVVPFSEAAAAEAFAADHGGRVVDWSELRAAPPGVDEISPDRTSDGRHGWAEDRLAAARAVADRPVGAVVGEDASTVQGAIDAAPNETTVVVPPGTYEEAVELDRPVTLRGPGATLRGDGNETVVTVSADAAAVVGVHVEGVGDRLQDPDAAADDPDAWDANIELGYGHGDAGVAIVGAADGAVVDVSIDTPANGVLLRDAPDAVVTNATINGSADWREGFMGVIGIRSPATIDGIHVDGGRDGVYLHRSDDTVIRDSSFRGGRFGVHVMHTSGAVVASNAIRDQDLGGVVLMTDPTGTAIVGNDVRRSANGIITDGRSSFVAENVVTDNGYGLRINDHASRYEANAVLDNDVGIKAGGFLPTNEVLLNDFVGNGRDVESGLGPLQVWTVEDVGNYWDGAAVAGAPDRAYAPTDPVDARLGRVDGAATLARSPGMAASRTFAEAVPGLRGGVVDLRPLAEPATDAGGATS